MKRPDLNLIYALDALLSEGSVKGAAHVMHLSPPAMSHALARLREAVGDPLLVRAGQRLVPTQRALALLGQARQLASQGSALLSPAKTDDGWTHEDRRFVVVAPDSFAVVSAARLLALLLAKMPNVSLTLLPDSTDDQEGLRSGAIDLEIRPVRPWASEIRLEVLNTQQLVVAVRRNHPLTAQRLTTNRYARSEHVCQTSPPEPIPTLDKFLVTSGLKRIIRLRLGTPYAALASASATDLVATVPEGLARGLARSLGLECLALPIELDAFRIVQAWHPRNDLEPAHQWLRLCVRSILSLSSPERNAIRSNTQ